QLCEREAVTQSGQLIVSEPINQGLPGNQRIAGLSVLEPLEPNIAVRFQPIPGLLPQRRSLLIGKFGRIVTDAATREGSRASGGVAVAGAQVVRPSRDGGERIGVKGGRGAGAGR